MAAKIREAVRVATGLSCSVGVGHNKLRAKLATGFAEPAGTYRLTRGNWAVVMAERPTDALWGFGRKTARRLAEAALVTVAQLARADPAELATQFGPVLGPWSRMLALGAGDTGNPAGPPRPHPERF
jgi:DNA polymerase-4